MRLLWSASCILFSEPVYIMSHNSNGNTIIINALNGSVSQLDCVEPQQRMNQ